jgi:7-keto-8-aminopelargonate synthetase-like enzyme
LLELGHQHEALLLVDDAHATGVIGPSGKGSAAFWGVPPDDFLTMGTFSKALGAFGGFLAGSELALDYLKNKARSLIYSTALPPAVCTSGLTAFSILREEPQRLESLRENISYFNIEINKLTKLSKAASTPIFPLIVGSEEKALKISGLLAKEGIYVPAIRPPTVPENQCRLRISLMATHTREHLDRLLSVLKKTI